MAVGSYTVGNINPEEWPCPLKEAAVDLRLLELPEAALFVRRVPFTLSLASVETQSRSTLPASSKLSPTLLEQPPPAPPDELPALNKLSVEELALMSCAFSFSLSSRSLNILDRASSYCAWRSDMVSGFLRDPREDPASEGSPSDTSPVPGALSSLPDPG